MSYYATHSLKLMIWDGEPSLRLQCHGHDQADCAGATYEVTDILTVNDRFPFPDPLTFPVPVSFTHIAADPGVITHSWGDDGPILVHDPHGLEPF